MNTLLLASALLGSSPDLYTSQSTAAIPSVSQEVVQPLPPPPTKEAEEHLLALALYFEARIHEPDEGLQAIASVILNRVRSPFFPDTITEVVSQGASPGKTTGGCQFSFMCDQYPEDIEVLCQLRPNEMLRHWGEDGCNNRFKSYQAFAKQYLLNGQDNTGKADMYYAASMKRAPYWHVDLVARSKRLIGSHWFAQSRRFLVVEAMPSQSE
jgi:spore germination cell wall hydrolase CwlJ-like protein